MSNDSAVEVTNSATKRPPFIAASHTDLRNSENEALRAEKDARKNARKAAAAGADH